jgi:hypothetical protein
MNITVENIIKIILSLLFFVCLLNMPYGYFQLVRFVALAGFAILAYKANEQGRKTKTIIYVCLGILFQPLVKIALGRQIWNTVDIVVGVALLVSLLMRPSNNPR